MNRGNFERDRKSAKAAVRSITAEKNDWILANEQGSMSFEMESGLASLDLQP
jgi:hypothetical protein